ncbi:hypothetical protein AQJ91_46895 [Streptomyces dysideae]|uniref:Sulfatase-modifying factor enzyme-like domain-containing protein n=1 Tax=Streptomyces dysideae TaxID=909626 RepID=A0A101UPF8_9ACTN|nr:hypothetical protein AQJ91_46895 [Streptomyces dysideae]
MSCTRSSASVGLRGQRHRHPQQHLYLRQRKLRDEVVGAALTALPHKHQQYKVLRGGSFATDLVACRATFRNWDYPVRRQATACFRTARDADTPTRLRAA